MNDVEKIFDYSIVDDTIAQFLKVKDTIKTCEEQNCTGLIEERKATVKDMQEMMFEVAVNIADLLGLEEIYLDEE